METNHDFVIGRDVVLEELDTLSDLLSCLPHKAQYGARSLMEQVNKLRLNQQLGVSNFKNLISKVKEKAQENFGPVNIFYYCFDASHDVFVFGTNLGIIFLFDRIGKHLSKLVIESGHGSITRVKLLASHSLVAGGHEDGKISVFSFMIASQGYGKRDSIQITSAHSEKITCLEWSPDGTVLYSGDTSGKIVMTIVKFGEQTPQTAVLFTEDSPVVQLSYSSVALLASTQKRSVIWKYTEKEPTQIGQKERKIIGDFGACFYPPARQTEGLEGQITAYVARPGLRLWTANIDCSVSSTLMYKGLVTENPPTIRTLSFSTGHINKSATSNQIPQFTKLLIFHGQFIVTWDSLRLWVLDTSPCSVLGYLDDLHAAILDVCTVGHEIFVLTQSTERMILKFSLLPVIPNPLIKLFVTSESDKKDSSSKSDDISVKHSPIEELENQLSISLLATSEINKTAGISSSSVHEDMLIVNAEMQPESNVITPPLVSRFEIESIPQKDYGDIVYSKAKKRNKKKKPKYDGKNTMTLAQEESLPLTLQISQPLSDDLSDISSDFDSTDRSETDRENIGYDQGSAGISEQEGIRDHLTLKLELNDQMQENRNAIDTAGITTEPHDDIRLHQETPLFDDDDAVLSRSLDCDMSNRPITKQSSTPITVESKVHSTESVPDTFSPPYLAKSFSNVYSNEEINLSDMSFSNKSFDKSSCGAKKLVYSPASPREEQSLPTLESLSVDSASLQCSETSDDNSPPCVLEKDGAEELVDASSWQGSNDGSISERILGVYDTSSDEDLVDWNHTQLVSESLQKDLTDSQVSTKPNMCLLADSWADYTGPCQGNVQYLTVSDTHLWSITSYDNIFYCPTHFSVKTWTQLDGNARMIATNVSGDVIWCIDRKNYAYYRAGVCSSRLTGRKWCPVEKEMRFVAVDDNCVWGIKLNGDVFLKTDVSSQRPQGKGWQTIKLDTSFVQASCLDGIVWFLDKTNVIHVYKGIESIKPANQENWEILPDVRARWICLDVEGVAFLADLKGSLWFTTNVTQTNRTGGDWFQISLGQYLMQDTGTVLDSLWSWVRPEIKAVAQAPKELIESLWSWVKRGDEAKLISASPKAGVWVQGSQGSIHAAHGHLLGSRWDPEVPAGVAQSVFWTYLSAGGCHSDGGHMWVVKPNGEMVCFQPGGRAVTVDPPIGSALKLLAVSRISVWGIKHNFQVVQRTGISNLCPEGYRWVDLKLSTFGIRKVMHLSCGALSTWAVDEDGQIWLRIGREEDTSQATQAWLPVEGKPLNGCRFIRVAVNSQDTIVWAVDDRFNVYARDKITPTFPIGTLWMVVPGTGVKDICVSQHKVWAICPNGDIACRYGVSETNCVGDYWKKVPGNFELISVSPDDRLWAIDHNGQLFRRKTQSFFGAQAPLKRRSYSTLFPNEDDWEFI